MLPGVMTVYLIVRNQIMLAQIIFFFICTIIAFLFQVSFIKHFVYEKSMCYTCSVTSLCNFYKKIFARMHIFSYLYQSLQRRIFSKTFNFYPLVGMNQDSRLKNE